jgi:hypothetical protein
MVRQVADYQHGVGANFPKAWQNPTLSKEGPSPGLPGLRLGLLFSGRPNVLPECTAPMVSEVAFESLRIGRASAEQRYQGLRVTV